MKTGDSRSVPAWAEWALQRPGQSHRVEVGGAIVHALSWGEESAGQPPLVLVHGSRAHAHWWDFVAPYLAVDRRVFALDLTGMGDSDWRTFYPRGVGADDIIGFCRTLELEDATLIGHSSGGVCALTACAREPGRFRHAVVIDSYLALEDAIHPAEPPRLRGDRVYPELAMALSRYRLMPEQPAMEPWVFDHVARHSLREVEGGWRWKFDPSKPTGLSQEEDPAKVLASISCPVHVVYGGDSSIVSPALAQRTARALSAGRGPIVVPGGHHHLMFDHPAALVAVLQALLA